MPRTALPRPTDGELEILQFLWRLGGRTVREIAIELSKTSAECPSSAVATWLKVMVDKQLVAQEPGRATRVFHAPDDAIATPEELDELSKRLKELRKRS